MSYHNLTNEEIVFLYYTASSVVKQYDAAFSDQSFTQSLMTEESIIQTVIDLPPDLIDELLNSKHYTMMKGIMLKLKPIYDLIKETQPELVEVIDDLFVNKPS
jgi:hypothetical protein